MGPTGLNKAGRVFPKMDSLVVYTKRQRAVMSGDLVGLRKQTEGWRDEGREGGKEDELACPSGFPGCVDAVVERAN